MSFRIATPVRAVKGEPRRRASIRNYKLLSNGLLGVVALLILVPVAWIFLA